MAIRRRPPDVPHPAAESDRSVGIWGIVAIFVAIAVVGLVVLLFIAPDEDESVPVPTSQTLPEGYEEPATSEQAAGSAPTLPGGAPAPEGVSEVDVGGGTTSLTFDPPAGATTDEGALAEGWTAQIAPARAEPSEDGSELLIRVGCGRSEDEFLAQLTVTEAETLVTVAAVAVAPDGGTPCPDGEPDRHVFTIQLGEPLGDRQLDVVPAGTLIDPDAAAAEGTP